jgi:hypothetical protein
MGFRERVLLISDKAIETFGSRLEFMVKVVGISLPFASLRLADIVTMGTR